MDIGAVYFDYKGYGSGSFVSGYGGVAPFAEMYLVGWLVRVYVFVR